MTITRASATAALPTGGLLIGDRWVGDSSGGRFAHVDPATGEPHPEIPLAGATEIDAAVLAARAAFPGWQAMGPAARRTVLQELGRRVTERAELLGAMTVLDNGTPVEGAIGGALACTDHFEYFAGWVDKIGGRVIPTWGEPDAFDYTLDEPYGVVGIIIPWNGPIYAIGMTLAPALCAGNCVVLKPPELAPFSALRFGELALEAGLPPGVLNVVPGGPEGGEALVRHRDVDKIHFTGSGATAQKVLAGALETLKPVGLELGGKSANLLFEDADLEAAAADAVVKSIGVLSGQGCMNGTRLLVQDSVYDEVAKHAVRFAESLALGDPFDPTTSMGPVIDDAACQRILGVIERARREKMGRLLTGGERAGGRLSSGYFIQPTIFGDVDNHTDLAQREIFGPVLAVLRFRDEDEAVRIANDTDYGLAAFVQTSDVRRAHRVAARLDAGGVWINGGVGPLAPMPFGGNKQSGYGRLGGWAGIREFVRTKNVYMSLAPRS